MKKIFSELCYYALFIKISPSNKMSQIDLGSFGIISGF